LDEVSANPLHRELYRRLAWAAAGASRIQKGETVGYRERLLKHHLGQQREVYILTTNWDTTLDEIVSLLAGPQMVDRGVDHVRKNSALGLMRIHYYKLNGSPDWLICRPCNTLLIEGEDIQIADAGDPTTEPHCTSCGDLFERVIVMPSATANQHPLDLVIDKEKVSFKEFNIISLHSTARRALMSAREFIFVGYSLPQYDQAIRQLIASSLESNSYFLERNVDVSVVAHGNEAQEVYARFTELFGGYPVKLFPDGLARYLENI
jgi:hypothetical protein